MSNQLQYAGGTLHRIIALAIYIVVAFRQVSNLLMIDDSDSVTQLDHERREKERNFFLECE